MSKSSAGRVGAKRYIETKRVACRAARLVSIRYTTQPKSLLNRRLLPQHLHTPRAAHRLPHVGVKATQQGVWETLGGMTYPNCHTFFRRLMFCVVLEHLNELTVPGVMPYLPSRIVNA